MADSGVAGLRDRTNLDSKRKTASKRAATAVGGEVCRRTVVFRATLEGESVLKAIILRHTKRDGQDGWEFPKQLEALVRDMTACGTVLQLFGGRARFGIRLDIDPVVRPDVIGDAWLPPFKRDAFDHVVIDPPYDGISTPNSGRTKRL